MTKKEFDPYHRWLGIPASEQPANHYRLLGIALFEADADVIESAAIRQITHVRSHALGSHGDTTQTVLNEIAEAKITLLHPEKKKQYDEGLRSAAKANEDSPLDVFIQTNVTATSSSAKQTSSKMDRWQNTKQRRQAYVAASAGWICFVLALMWFGFGNEPTGNPVARPSVKQASKTSPKKPETSITRNVKPPPPTAVAPFDAAKAKEHQQAWANHLGIPVVTTNSIGMKLALIPPGEFLMGSDEFEEDEKPVHKVTLTQPFQLGVYEVTQEQYEKVVGDNPSKFKGPQNPVEQVSWIEAFAFCKMLSDLPEEKAAGRIYHLPAESQWEYSCRAGTATVYGFGDDVSKLGDFAWYKENTRLGTRPVGEKLPNAWGIFGMHGNTWEWCADWKGNYPQLSVVDPEGPLNGSVRVSRGGHWDTSSITNRTANRGGSSPSTRYGHQGFRVACLISDDKQPTTTAITSVESKPLIPENAVQFGGHHYQLVANKVTRMQAKKDAEEKGGHLLRVDSGKEFYFAASLVPRQFGPRFVHVWIDGSRLLQGGKNWLYENGDRVDLNMFPSRDLSERDHDFFLNLGRNSKQQVYLADAGLTYSNEPEIYGYIIEWDN
jgi:formylglycine-generating enzyme required for sulfatase activity